MPLMHLLSSERHWRCWAGIFRAWSPKPGSAGIWRWRLRSGADDGRFCRLHRGDGTADLRRNPGAGPDGRKSVCLHRSDQARDPARARAVFPDISELRELFRHPDLYLPFARASPRYPRRVGGVCPVRGRSHLGPAALAVDRDTRGRCGGGRGDRWMGDSRALILAAPRRHFGACPQQESRSPMPPISGRRRSSSPIASSPVTNVRRVRPRPPARRRQRSFAGPPMRRRSFWCSRNRSSTFAVFIRGSHPTCCPISMPAGAQACSPGCSTFRLGAPIRYARNSRF